MPQSPSTSTKFHTIFVAAMKSYEKKTKTDLHNHPLAGASQHNCSPATSSDNLAVLQDKFNEIDKPLNPTINILYALSVTLGQGVGLHVRGDRVAERGIDGVRGGGGFQQPSNARRKIFSPSNVVSGGIGVLLLLSTGMSSLDGAEGIGANCKVVPREDVGREGLTRERLAFSKAVLMLRRENVDRIRPHATFKAAFTREYQTSFENNRSRSSHQGLH
ncbi:hypothetical protein V8E53_011969 [Lactarius tabidus]